MLLAPLDIGLYVEEQRLISFDKRLLPVINFPEPRKKETTSRSFPFSTYGNPSVQNDRGFGTSRFSLAYTDLYENFSSVMRINLQLGNHEISV